MTVLRQLPLSTVHVLSTPCIFPPWALPLLSFFPVLLPSDEIATERYHPSSEWSSKFSEQICESYISREMSLFRKFCRFFLSFIAALWANRRYLLCVAAMSPRSTCQKYWISANRMHKRFSALLVYFFFNIETRKDVVRYPMVKIS